jgi:hypothetical protein
MNFRILLLNGNYYLQFLIIDRLVTVSDEKKSRWIFLLSGRRCDLPSMIDL